MHRILFLFAFSLFSYQASADSLEKALEAFGLLEVDLSSFALGSSSRIPHWVSTQDGELLVSRARPETIAATEIRIGELLYVGTNRGEWGGELLVRHEGETKNLMSGNIVQLELWESSLLVLEGLAHLSLYSGSLSIIRDPDNPTKPTLLARLPDAPRLMYIDDDETDLHRFIIPGYQSLLSYTPEYGLEILERDALWGRATWGFQNKATSVTRFKDYYLVGIYGGVVALPAPWGGSSQQCLYRCSEVRFFTLSES